MSILSTKSIIALFAITALFYIVICSSITYPLTTLLKPIPIVFLMLAVWRCNTVKPYKIWLMLALGFSLLGDIMLTLPINTALELGIGFFMLAHLSYISLFLKNYTYQPRQMAYFSPILILSVFMFFYLQPYVGSLLVPVSVYIGVLTVMVFCAFQNKTNTVLLASGALIFMLSDLMLALEKFVLPDSYLSVLIMPAYYLAQCLLVLAVIKPVREERLCQFVCSAQ